MDDLELGSEDVRMNAVFRVLAYWSRTWTEDASVYAPDVLRIIAVEIIEALDPK